MPTIITSRDELSKVSANDSVILIKDACYFVIRSQVQSPGETGSLGLLMQRRGWVVKQARHVASKWPWLERVLDR